MRGYANEREYARLLTERCAPRERHNAIIENSSSIRQVEGCYGCRDAGPRTHTRRFSLVVSTGADNPRRWCPFLPEPLRRQPRLAHLLGFRGICRRAYPAGELDRRL